jgi:CHAD domain-containing protein
LADAVASQTSTFVEELARARRGDTRGVHRARTMSRRLREMLPLTAVAAPGAGADRVRRDVRRIARLLGAVREIDVAVSELTQAAASRPDWDPVAVVAVEQELVADRAEAMREVSAKIAALDVGRLGARIESVASAVASDPAPHMWPRALARRLRRRSAAVVEAVKAAGTIYESEHLHAVRIAAKKLRYGLELTREAAGLPVGTIIASLKKIQDELGKLRDLEWLAGRIREMAEASGDRAAGRHETMALALDRECRELHASYLAKRGTLVALAERTSDDVARALLGRGPRMMKLGAAALPSRESRTPTSRPTRVGRRSETQ